MEVKLAGGINPRKEMLYVFITLAIVCLFLLPTLLSNLYLKVMVTIGNTITLILTGRLYISTLLGMVGRKKKASIKDWPFVSILVPAYNEEAVLPRSLDSMLSLDYPRNRIEFVYVYEDNCTDRTKEIILEYAKRDPRLKPVKRTAGNGGKAAAINYGLQYCNGEIIGSFDADHSLEPSVVKKAVHWLQDSKVACVKGRCRTINKDESLLAKITGVDRDIWESLWIYQLDIVHGFSFFGGGHVFLKKSVIDEIGLFDENIMTEDIDYSVRTHKAGYEIRVDPTMVSWEESPAFITQWWHQRKRWSRGWMQCGTKHLWGILTCKRLSVMKKTDIMFSLSMPFILPMLFPLAVLMYLGYVQGSFYPDWLMFYFSVVVMLNVPLATICVWVKDIRNREKMRWNEIPLIILLVPYTFLNQIVSWTAFEDELILKRKREFLKTKRTGFQSSSKYSQDLSRELFSNPQTTQISCYFSL